MVTTVETYEDGVLVETREVPEVDLLPAPMQVMVDPQALSAAQAAIGSATTVMALRKATLDALDLLNPGTD